MTTSNDAAGGREWNPYELATPLAAVPAGAAVPPPLAHTPAADAYAPTGARYAPRSSSPYAAPRARVEELASDDVVLAGRLTRLLAAIVDNLTVMLPLAFVAYAGYRQMRMSAIGAGASTSATAALLLAGAMLIGFFVWNIVLLVTHGQTVGKRLLGIRIARPDGEKAGFWRIALLRVLLISVIYAILEGINPLLGAVFMLVNLLMIFGEHRRCLHDIVADTIVVQAR